MQELIFTVEKIAGYIKNIFENEQLLQDILIKGEVSNYSETGGNAYFVLKGGDAQINCVYFATDLRNFIPKNGDMCIAKGSVSYYKKGGKVSFNVTNMRPAGAGDNYVKFLQLKDKLDKEGIFDAKNKIGLPYFVGKLGVVTSRTGAVIHDIIKIAVEKYKGIDIVLYSVKVQGLSAEKDIAQGISIMDRQGVDVIIVARGGGSAEDLQAYNTETVARAVYECKTPIISAVGHETDYTLCDMAADVRAATPTAAAELAVANADYMEQFLTVSLESIYKSTVDRFNRSLYNVKNSCKSMVNSISGNISTAMAETKYKILENCHIIENRFNSAENIFNNLLSSVDAKNPLKLLKSGYAVITDEKGSTVKLAVDLTAKQNINVFFSDGRVLAEVKDVKIGG